MNTLPVFTDDELNFISSHDLTTLAPNALDFGELEGATHGSYFNNGDGSAADVSSDMTHLALARYGTVDDSFGVKVCANSRGPPNTRLTFIKEIKIEPQHIEGNCTRAAEKIVDFAAKAHVVNMAAAPVWKFVKPTETMIVHSILIDKNMVPITVPMVLTPRANCIKFVPGNESMKDVTKALGGTSAYLGTFEHARVPLIISKECVNPVLLYKLGIKLTEEGDCGIVFEMGVHSDNKIGKRVLEFLFDESSKPRDANALRGERVAKRRRIVPTEVLSLRYAGVMGTVIAYKRKETSLWEVLQCMDALLPIANGDVNIINGFKLILATTNDSVRSFLLSELYLSLSINEIHAVVDLITRGAYNFALW